MFFFHGPPPFANWLGIRFLKKLGGCARSTHQQCLGVESGALYRATPGIGPDEEKVIFH